MFVRRTAFALSRASIVRPVGVRTFALSASRFSSDPSRATSGEAQQNIDSSGVALKKSVPFNEVKTEEDLLPPGAERGTVPTDFNQSTGLERLEILGKMQGVDIFDMKPLDSSRTGTMQDPIVVNSAGDEQYVGCTGCPADSHVVQWLGMSRKRPIERCPECGSVYKMQYVGPPDDPHGHDHGHEHGDAHHNYEEPKTFADYVKPEYY